MPSELQKKSPVSRLQELCLYNGFVVRYALENIEGDGHNPNFAIGCFVEDESTVAIGSSKKRAKHGAAIEMLKRMSGRSLTKKELALRDWNPDLDENSGDVEEVGPENVNAVGKLQEMCMKMKWPAPRFEESVVKSEQKMTFAVTCTIDQQKSLQSYGEGVKKRFAKREAALRMMQIISELSVEEDDETFPFTEKYTYFEENDNIDVLSTESKLNDKSVTKLFDRTVSDSPLLATLSEEAEPLELETDYCDDLSKMVKKMKLSIEYLEIPLKNKSGKYQWLLAIHPETVSATEPPLSTYWGSHSSRCMAKQDAARRALFNYFDVN